MSDPAARAQRRKADHAAAWLLVWVRTMSYLIEPTDARLRALLLAKHEAKRAGRTARAAQHRANT